MPSEPDQPAAVAEPVDRTPPDPFAPPSASSDGPSAADYQYPFAGLPERGVSGLAVASFVFGILGFALVTWAVSLGLGIAALRRIRRRPQRGKGLAITGIVLSCVWALLLALAVPSLLAGAKEGFDEGLKEGTISGLKPGDCFNSQGGTFDTSSLVTAVPCTEPHRGEAFGIIQLSREAVRSDDREALERTRAECLTMRHGYLLDRLNAPPGGRVRFNYPSRTRVVLTKPEAICFFELPSPAERSFQQTRSSFTAEQYGYLAAEQDLNKVADQWPGAPSPSSSLTEYQSWAEQIVPAARAARDVLDALQWGERTRQPVADRRAELDRLISLADELRKLTDPAQLAGKYDGIRICYFGHADLKARAALGLRLTVLSEEELG